MNQKSWAAEVSNIYSVIHLMIAVGAFSCAPARADGAQFPSMERHGTVHESACTKKNQAEWKKTIHEVNAKSPREAIKAISVLLCSAPTPSNRQFLASLLMPKVMWGAGSTDNEQPPRLLDRRKLKTEELFAQGAAFRVGITDRPNELEIGYLSNEVCVASKKLRFIGGQWRLTAISAGCE